MYLLFSQSWRWLPVAACRTRLGWPVDRPPTVAVIDSQAAAEQIHQPPGSLRAVELVVAPGAVGHKQSAVAVLLSDAQHFPAAVSRPHPRRCARISPRRVPHPLQRVLQPVGVILPAQVSPAAHAGAQLWGCGDIGPVVRLQPGDHPILYMGDQQAAPAAVMRRAAYPNQLFGGDFSLDRFFWFAAEEFQKISSECGFKEVGYF